MKEKPSEISDTKAIVRMPSAAPTMDPAIASRLLWKADPMLLLNVTTAARSNKHASLIFLSSFQAEHDQISAAKSTNVLVQVRAEFLIGMGYTYVHTHRDDNPDAGLSQEVVRLVGDDEQHTQADRRCHLQSRATSAHPPKLMDADHVSHPLIDGLYKLEGARGQPH